MNIRPLVLGAWMAVIAITIPAHDAHAQATLTPVEQARLLIRAFRFDANLPARGALHIAVLHAGDAAAAEPIRWALEEMGASGVQGLPVRATAVRFVNVAELLARVEADGVTALYVPEELASALSSIQQVARGRKIPSITGHGEFARQGLALAAVASDSGPTLWVNARSAQVEGLALAPELLAVAEVIR